MPILYSPENHVFHLQNANISYIIRLVAGKYPIHQYWGRRVRAIHADAMERCCTQQEENFTLHGLPLDTLPQECPVYGCGDLRQGMLEVRQADGSSAPFTDWVHAASKVPMIKMQHPEYETFIDGTHGAAGVSCADCHMPYQRVDGKKVSSHWMTSPLKDPELRACRQCHADKTADYLRGRVLYTQEKTFTQLLKAQEESVRAHEAVRLANAVPAEQRAANYDSLMAEAREMVRKGQLYWDYVSAENSVGFHNPAKALDTLMSSMEFSHKAVALAEQATGYSISPALAGDIKQIVPPILNMSRKLQQDADFLQQHPWTRLLPVLPKAEQVWDGQELSAR